MIAATAMAAAGLVQDADIEVRLLSYNIWMGGTQNQPLEQTAEVIQKSGADIVGIQEPGENLERLAEMMGWHHCAHSSILSRWSIAAGWDVPGVRWGGAEIALESGETLWVYNVHLTAYPYGPYEIRDGSATTEAEVVQVEEESGRVREVRAILADIEERCGPEDSVFLLGDFNAPSHLDWVAATRERNFGVSMRWPVSLAVESSGFGDAYREHFPDPVGRPGFTWSPGYPVGTLDPDDVMDRIDFVYYRGARVRLDSAAVVGEVGRASDIGINPWPSDHRAVLGVFRLLSA